MDIVAATQLFDRPVQYLAITDRRRRTCVPEHIRVPLAAAQASQRQRSATRSGAAWGILKYNIPDQSRLLDKIFRVQLRLRSNGHSQRCTFILSAPTALLGADAILLVRGR